MTGRSSSASGAPPTSELLDRSRMVRCLHATNDAGTVPVSRLLAAGARASGCV